MFERESTMERHAWVPGSGPDVSSVLRLTSQFQAPSQPMGEAWFMAIERRMFTELMWNTPDQWTPDLLDKPLYDLASGPCSFGCLPEWTIWTHFFLAQLPTRIDGPAWTPIYEQLVSAFMAQYPDERVDGPYEGFYFDVLATLGKIPMSSANWTDGQLSGDGTISSIEPMASGPFISCGGAFSAALFLQLKYLRQADIAAWLSSALAIRDHIWRIKFILWIEASSPVLLDFGQPDKLAFDSNDGSGWQPSWCLKGNSPCKHIDPSQAELPFINQERQRIFRDTVKDHISVADLDMLSAYLIALDTHYPGMAQTYGRFRGAVERISSDYGLA